MKRVFRFVPIESIRDLKDGLFLQTIVFLIIKNLFFTGGNKQILFNFNFFGDTCQIQKEMIIYISN
ncbi:hypothetical protein IW16_02845 [Chryseobacterium vrystaatense]|uniref:Uncharacterized protein n=1 Tax=Chryseobacterium vrystaatense TaxID=307480 RepID=A0ABR4USN8_9FLAO|nr:hypothetical protein IW16_02845 [Chryseobacterium vrystaatense]